MVNHNASHAHTICLLCLLSLISFDVTNNKQNSSVCVCLCETERIHLLKERRVCCTFEFKPMGIAKGVLH